MTCEKRNAKQFRILWIVSSPLPEASRLFDVLENAFGGWLVGSALSLRGRGIDLTIAHVSDAPTRESKRSETVTYVALPASNFQEDLDELIKEIRPDLLHVHGTEGDHSLTAVECAKRTGTPSVVSIQGMLYYYSLHYTHGIPARVRYGFTLRDILRRTNPELGRRDFQRRGTRELETIRLADYIIGRTAWDKGCVLQSKPEAHYFHCNEIMRPTFYEAEWRWDLCKRHSILVSQGAYPLKGLHRVLEALPTILREFPDTHLYVAGPDPTHGATKLGFLKNGSYGAYLRRLITDLGLRDAVTFTGVRDEAAMLKSFLGANVFVLPSSIENSPNSLVEAMLVGVPAVSAYVGGVPSMLGEESGVVLYQSDAPYMLADAVLTVFRNASAATDAAARARHSAHLRHSPDKNADQLMTIYSTVMR